MSKGGVVDPLWQARSVTAFDSSPVYRTKTARTSKIRLLTTKGAVEMCVHHGCIAEICALQLCEAEISLYQAGAHENCVAEIGPVQLRTVQLQPTQRGAAEIGIFEHSRLHAYDVLHIHTPQVGTIHVATVEGGRLFEAIESARRIASISFDSIWICANHQSVFIFFVPPDGRRRDNGRGRYALNL